MLYIPVMLICFIKNFDELAPFSMGAIFLTVVGIAIIYEVRVHSQLSTTWFTKKEPLYIVCKLLLQIAYCTHTTLYICVDLLHVHGCVNVCLTLLTKQANSVKDW